jgi:hypothetical protein
MLKPILQGSRQSRCGSPIKVHPSELLVAAYLVNFSPTSRWYVGISLRILSAHRHLSVNGMVNPNAVAPRIGPDEVVKKLIESGELCGFDGAPERCGLL